MKNNINNEKVLLQFSGGKDSTACFLFLKQNNINFEAIHFTHSYAYDIPLQMTKKICSKYEVKLTIINIKKEIENLFLNNFNKRPCRYCKSIMDSKTVEYAIQNKINLICVGDTKDDSMLINRLKAENQESFEFSKYFNQGVSLPENISVYRPMINTTSSEILDFVYKNIPDFSRVNDTGDKYFEYSREGCPLQFKDLGAFFSKELMAKLKKYNLLCSEFAKKNDIKASIHLPSEFIVTIPKGYENMCREYLISHGCNLTYENPISTSFQNFTIIISLIETMNTPEIIKEATERFIERLGYKISTYKIIDNFGFINGDNFILTLHTMFAQTLVLSLSTKDEIKSNFLDNIIIEIFHTSHYELSFSSFG